MIKLLIVHDTEIASSRGEVIRWAYANRSYALKKYAPSDFEVDRICADEFDFDSAVANYDVIFYMDYMGFQSLIPKLMTTGHLGKFVVSFNKDSNSRKREWMLTSMAKLVIVNNEERYFAGGVRENTCCISNGVDTDFWKPTRPIEGRSRVLWCGSSSVSKMKNYHNVIAPLGQLLKEEGLDFSFRPIDHIDDSVFTPEEQRDWYNTADVVVCASSSEGGGPSYLMEAAACGCIPVTTEVGSVPEWAGACNAEIVQSSGRSLLEGIKKARLDKAARSMQAAKGILQQGYGEPGSRAKYFFQVFRLIAEGKSPTPFTYRNVSPDEIVSS